MSGKAHLSVPMIRALIVDAESPLAAIAEIVAILDALVRRSVGDTYDPDRCQVWSRPGGLDLRCTSRPGRPRARDRAARPRLVVAGPVSKLDAAMMAKAMSTPPKGS